MKAIQYGKHGGPEVLELCTVPDPEVPHGRAIVRVMAAAINHLDIHFRRGIASLPTPLPHVPGCDGAGVVAAVGPGVTGWREGDRVTIFAGVSCGACDDCGRGEVFLCTKAYLLGRETDGTYAELIAVPAANLLAVPVSIGRTGAAR